MADKVVTVVQQLLKPIKLVKWKVNEGNSISIGCVYLLYELDEDHKHFICKLKSTHAGTVHKLLAQEGDVVKPGEGLLELQACCHPTVMRDMCAECGADLRKHDIVTSASVPMVHSVPELKVSLEQAKKIGKADVDRLLKNRKLVLLLDLDQTLIHTTNDNIPANIKDVYHFQLYGAHSPWYHTRLRPGTHQFLSNMSPYFELHICTFGARNYAHMIAMFLDQDGKLFSHRILSRDECFDPTSKTANLKALFPCGDNLVCIIDDREDVWSYATNLIHVKPYHFFQHTGDINAPPGLDKHESDEKEGVDLTKLSSRQKRVKINGSVKDSKIGDEKESELCNKIIEQKDKKLRASSADTDRKNETVAEICGENRKKAKNEAETGEHESAMDTDENTKSFNAEKDSAMEIDEETCNLNTENKAVTERGKTVGNTKDIGKENKNSSYKNRKNVHSGKNESTNENRHTDKSENTARNEEEQKEFLEGQKGSQKPQKESREQKDTEAGQKESHELKETAEGQKEFHELKGTEAGQKESSEEKEIEEGKKVPQEQKESQERKETAEGQKESHELKKTAEGQNESHEQKETEEGKKVPQEQKESQVRKEIEAGQKEPQELKETVEGQKGTEEGQKESLEQKETEEGKKVPQEQKEIEAGQKELKETVEGQNESREQKGTEERQKEPLEQKETEERQKESREQKGTEEGKKVPQEQKEIEAGQKELKETVEGQNESREQKGTEERQKESLEQKETEERQKESREQKETDEWQKGSREQKEAQGGEAVSQEQKEYRKRQKLPQERQKLPQPESKNEVRGKNESSNKNKYTKNSENTDRTEEKQKGARPGGKNETQKGQKLSRLDSKNEHSDENEHIHESENERIYECEIEDECEKEQKVSREEQKKARPSVENSANSEETTKESGKKCVPVKSNNFYSSCIEESIVVKQEKKDKISKEETDLLPQNLTESQRCKEEGKSDLISNEFLIDKNSGSGENLPQKIEKSEWKTSRKTGPGPKAPGERLEESTREIESETNLSDKTDSKEEDFVEIEDPDDYLIYLENILKTIHNTFYDRYDKMEVGNVPDLKKVIPEVKKNVLKGTKLVFSGLVPTHIKLEQSKAYQVAKSLGAVVTQDLETDTTHLVAVRPGTAKVNAGRRRKTLKIVTPDWLWCCAERWSKAEEELFTLSNKGSKNRHPPPHCSSPEHNMSPAQFSHQNSTDATNSNPPQEITSRKRTPSGRFMDTINPLMSFSTADIADMDREVEDIFNESESDGESSSTKKPSIFLELEIKPKESDEESSSSAESLTGEHPHGWRPVPGALKRPREDQDADDESTADEFPSTKFRRGELLSSDLDIGQDSNSDGSVDAPDEIDDGDWNMMGAALEREFLANN